MENMWGSSENQNTQLPYDPAVPIDSVFKKSVNLT